MLENKNCMEQVILLEFTTMIVCIICKWENQVLSSLVFVKQWVVCTSLGSEFNKAADKVNLQSKFLFQHLLI